MARRRRSRIPRKRSSRWLVATQVVMLIGALVVILFFRDFIAEGAGEMFGSFGTSDVQVQKSAPPSEDSAKATPPDASSTDAVE